MSFDGIDKVIWGLILAILIAAAIAIVYEIRHPCLEGLRYTCTVTECNVWIADSNGATNCYGWDTHLSTCYKCTKRK